MGDGLLDDAVEDVLRHTGVVIAPPKQVIRGNRQIPRRTRNLLGAYKYFQTRPINLVSVAVGWIDFDPENHR